jgi:hypothetical protein
MGNVRIDQELLRQLQRLRRALSQDLDRDISVKELIDIAVAEYLQRAREKRPPTDPKG